MKPEEYSLSALSFLGDAVYELEIRNHLVESGIRDGDKLHRECTKYVRAEAQAKVVKRLLKEAAEATGDSFRLTPEEASLVKRARNHKFQNRARSAGPVEYRLATGLEALMGYLYLTGKGERAKEIAGMAMKIIGGKNE